MKHTIKYMILLAALLLGVAHEAQATLTADSIKIVKLPAGNESTVTVKEISGRKVTITITPAAGFYVNKTDIVVEKLAYLPPSASSAPRRAVPLAEPIPLESGPDVNGSTGDYVFTVPEGYAGAQVTVTFSAKTAATATVKPNDLTYNQAAQQLVTGTVEGGTLQYRVGTTGVFSADIPTETNVGTYKVFYKIVSDEGHTSPAFNAETDSVEATIRPAMLTKVTLKTTAKKKAEGALTFEVDKVYAGEMEVPSTDYVVTGNTATEIGSYTATVTGKNNYEGTATANYQIVGTTVVLVDKNTEATALDADYVLTEDVPASVFAGLYDSETPKTFTGTLDGDMYTISGISHALFNTVSGGTVKNVMLSDVKITSGTNVGAIANEVIGTSTKMARIYNCGVMDGSISGSGKVGGLVGILGQDGNTTATNDNCYARVINCFSYADIKGGADKGGIVGYNCYATNKNNLRSMVMNCMFYGDIAEGGNIAPIYGGKNISNKDDKGVSNFNYFRAEASYAQNRKINVNNGNSALMAETRFLQQFEFFRHLLNGHRELAAYWATGNVSNKNQMMKWVMIPDSIGTKHPYPVLMRPGKYPSVVNFDAEHATYGKERNQGGKLGTLTVNIEMGSGGAVYGAPTGASITKSILTLNITDKDTLHYNYNYYKVQLPYYNDVGTKNYTGNLVVVGWKITSISGGSEGSFNPTVTTAPNDAPNWNFADRNCTAKDLYSVSGRIFNQGDYWDVPEGVTAITIQPYWAKAAYVADEYRDVVYNTAMGTKYNVETIAGGQWFTNDNDHTFTFGSEDLSLHVYNTISNAVTALSISKSHTVYDYAIVFVGNYHQKDGISNSKDVPYTLMSIDLDKDNEPDYSYILRFDSRTFLHPMRVDFLSVPGLGMAQKATGSSGSFNFGIPKPRDWFEVTNTALFRVTQFEYSPNDRNKKPIILHGGVIEQMVSSQGADNSSGDPGDRVSYFHLGDNVWFKEFHIGVHQDYKNPTPHPAISVTGGDYVQFYLTGLYRADANKYDDNVECYVNGGRFGVMAGAGMEGVGITDGNGNITWQIDHADITEFYGGGINAANPAIGNISTTISNSHVGTFCGGPKFGDMTSDKTVTTTATNCVFGTYFGAGYGGNSYSRRAPSNKSNVQNIDWNEWVRNEYKQDWNITHKGISTQIDYQFIPMSGNASNVARLFVEYVKFSLATCNTVTSNLTGCTVTGNFYGGGSLGKVGGDVSSTLTRCTIKGSAFGAGFSASIPTVAVDSIGFRVEPYYYSDFGTYRTAVKGKTTTYQWQQRKDGETVSSTATGIYTTDKDKILYTNEDLTTLGTVTGLVTLNIEDGTTIDNDVFGGGESSNTAGSVRVNFKSGTARNVYGGGSMANVGGDTEVNLMGGTIRGNVFGGGKGDDGHSATVGNTLVKLNEPVVDDKGEKTYPYDCEVKGNIFGCNDVNGSPQGNASVFIYKTAGGSVTKKADLDNETATHHYQLKAVYGGGNLAAYIPSAANMETATTRVVIDGCDMTSIQQVYGGGNAASTPATKVEVLGTYEIEEVFGGGNGKDDITVGSETKRNPGANVGYRNYAKYQDDGSVTEESDATTVAVRKAKYLYGLGKASVNIYGGLVHRVFGGSNTLGNVREVAVTLLDGQETCDFQIDEAYGGGKSAPMDGAAQLVMACIPGLKAAYGGAEEADINDNVTLNITNGTFDRVFGGNNVQGTIRGKITVNIEETGCHPIIIGQLYGGGNQAPYTATNPEDGPTLNIKSFTSIGDVYGGGYGKTAKVTGDTHVNINVGLGDFAGQDVDEDLMGPNKPITFTEYLRNTDVEETDKQYGAFIMKKDEHGDDTNERDYQTPTIYVTRPLHEPNRIGAIQNVFGGGNQAKVVGSTYVNIGTEDTVTLETKMDDTKEGEDKRVVLEVKGADIRGNVYGGGNQAEVTGSTNVVIGKKAAE